MKKLFTTLVLFTLGFTSYAQQDAQFTQYMYNTISVNPAYAGSRDVLSIFGLIRTQWVGLDGAPKTAALSLHSPIPNSRLGVGLSFINDRIGPSDENTLSADVSYTIPTSGKYKLAFGIKATASLLNIDFTKLNEYNPNDVLGMNVESKFFPNIGAGVYYYSDSFYLGFSVPNMLETEHYNENSTTNLATERLHYNLIAGKVFDLSPSLKFKPSVLGKLVQGAPLQVDVSGNFLINDKLTLGLAYRWSAALSGLVGFQLSDSWLIGYAYDRETTNLGNFNSGSHELFLRYELFKSYEKVVSPRFF
jgi:type IX secretion system PorP/SprF family membrane protein